MKKHIRILLSAIIVIMCISSVPLTPAKASTTINVMSYNLKNTNYSFDAVASMVNKSGAEIIGIQESTLVQQPLLSTAMKAIGFSCVKGSERGDGEYAPIYYKSSKFSVFRSGTFWLSDTPDEQSKYSESSYYRICTWACFQVTGADEYLIVFNTHLDFGSDLAVKQMNVILDQIAIKTGELPRTKNHIIVTGDFNTSSAGTPLKYFLGDTTYNSQINLKTKQRLDESRQVASQVVLNSFGNYYTQAASNPTSDIDHILISPYGFDCTYYEVISDAAGSDHLPIIAKLIYKPADHNYEYQWKEDGKHGVYCTHCGYTTTGNCKMSGGYCTLCGGGEAEDFYMVTDVNDLTTGRYIMVAAATGAYPGNSAYYAVGTRRDSGFNALVSYPMDFTDLPETIHLEKGENSKIVWQLTGDASAFTLTHYSGKTLNYGANSDLFYGRKDASTWTATMSTTTYHSFVKCGNSYLSLRTDLNTIGSTDVNSPLFTGITNTSMGNYKIYFYKHYEECQHPNISSVTTPATCVEDGCVVTTCDDCALVLSTQTIAASGHNYGYVVTAPTCTAQGFTTYTCTVCADRYVGEYTQTIPHSYKTAVTPATCTAGGFTTYTCSACGDSYRGNETAAKGHSYQAVVTKPTCTLSGYTTYTCSTCGDSYQGNETAAKGHSYQAVVTKPTCTLGGYTTYTCSACGKSYQDHATAPIAHDYAESKTSATCTQNGTSIFTCKNCGTSYEEVLPATGHNYVRADTHPTCTQSGSSKYICVNCGDSYVSDYVSATGHNYTAVTTAATCTSAGKTVYTCTNCSQSYSETIPMTGHAYSTITTSATCTQEGKTTHTCQTCGYSYDSAKTAPIGHDYTTRVITPSCTQEGMTVYTCLNCSDSYSANMTPALGHSYDAEIVEATCYSEGSATYNCTRCGDRYTQKLPQILHNLLAYPKREVTCTQDGYVEHYQCDYCKKYFIDAQAAFEVPESYVVVKATGHSCVYYSYVDSTCTQDGHNAYYYCAQCDGYFFDAKAQYAAPKDFLFIEATGHSYADGICTNCGAAERTEPEIKYNENLTLSMAVSVGAEMQVTYTVYNARVKSYESFYVEVVKEVADGESVTTVYSLDENNLAALNNPVTGALLGYNAIYTGINASMMGDNFTATLYAVTAEGTIEYGPSTTSSIKTYLTGLLEDSATIAELKTLAVDMLNYGAAAQSFFGYDVENPVNADLTEEQKALGTQEIPAAADTSSITGTGGAIMTDVSLQSKVMLYLTFIYTAKEDSNLTVVIKDSEGKVLEELVPTQAAAIAWQTIYSNVGAKQMRESITIELHDNGTCVSKTLTWNIESYVAQTRAKADASEALINSVNAMLTYGDSAAAYMIATGQ